MSGNAERRTTDGEDKDGHPSLSRDRVSRGCSIRGSGGVALPTTGTALCSIPDPPRQIRSVMTETYPAAPVSEPAGLDPQLLDSLAADGLLAMDDGELFLEARQEEQLTFEDGRLKVAARESRAGFGFRGVAGERVGYACGDRLEEEAIRARRRGRPGRGGRPWRPRERGAGDTGAAASTAPRSHRERGPRAQARRPGADRRLLPGAGAGRGQRHRHARRVAPGGRDLPRRRRRRTDLRPLVRLNVQVIVERDGRREQRQPRRRRPLRPRRCSRTAAGRQSPTRPCARRWSTSTRSTRRPAR